MLMRAASPARLGPEARPRPVHRSLLPVGGLAAVALLAGCGWDGAPDAPSGAGTAPGQAVATQTTPLPPALGVDEDGDGYSGILDCDDTDPYVHALMSEECDGRDSDCDGEVDEGCVDPPGFVPPPVCHDRDRDGECDPPRVPPLDGDPGDDAARFSDCPEGQESCREPPPRVERGCRDRDKDGVCDPLREGDLDGDWFTGEDDCDETDPDVHVGVAETCGDGVDNDCDGVIDEEHCL